MTKESLQEDVKKTNGTVELVEVTCSVCNDYLHTIKGKFPSFCGFCGVWFVEPNSKGPHLRLVNKGA